MGYDHLPVAQETSGQRYGFGHQTAAILAQVQDQAFDFRFIQLLQGGFHVARHVLRFEAGHLEEGDARLDPERIHEAGFDLAANHGDGDRFGGALAHHGDLHRAAALAAQKVGNAGGIFLGDVLAVNRDDHVAAAQVGAPCGGTGERLHGNHLGAVHGNQHADAEILGALLALHVLVFVRVEEIGVRIERAQHARNRALVDRLFRGDGVGVILLQQ